MKLRARHRGIDEMHDGFFDRIVGRTVSRVTHFDDQHSEMHYHDLVFSKPGEPDASLPIVPVTALVRPHFALSRQRVQELQQLLSTKTNELVNAGFSSFEVAQLAYCIGAVWAVSWLPLEDGHSLKPAEPKPLLELPPLAAYQQLIEGTRTAPEASGSPSDVAALSGDREAVAVPPEASPKGRKDLARFSRLGGLSAIEVCVQNETEFVVSTRATSEGEGGLLKVIVHVSDVYPQEGAIWPE